MNGDTCGEEEKKKEEKGRKRAYVDICRSDTVIRRCRGRGREVIVIQKRQTRSSRG